MGRYRRPLPEVTVPLRPVAIAAIVAVVAATLVLVTQSPVAAASVNTVSAGSSHSCALFAEGSVKCWGENGSGQLGQGSTTDLGDGAGEMGDDLDPIDLGTGRTATAFATGGDYTCAILDNGNVKCWGLGSAGQLGQGNDTTLGKAAGEMGDNLLAIDLGTGRTATAISVGQNHTCALLDNGNVKCWGEGSSGRLGQGSTSDLGDGAGEMGDDLDPVDLGTGRTATAISTGHKHTCALLDNGNVKCWGLGSAGQLGQGNDTTLGKAAGEMGDNLLAIDLGTGRTATAISVGQNHTCALLDNGNVKCWGEGSSGRLGQGSSDDLGDGAGEMGDNLSVIKLGAGFTLSTTTASVTEAGSTATFTVVLDTQPTSDVVLTVVSADTDEATVSPTPLTFTNANWNTPQTVTVTGIDDSIDDGDQDTTITIAVDDDNSDNAFDGVADQTVTATTTDNDTAAYTLSTTTASVTEAGSTATFTVVLDTQPTSDVVLTVVSADTDEATVSPTPLTFTNANWNTPQTVTVTGVDDSIDDDNQDTTVTIAVDDDNSDNAFDGLADQTVTATTTDDDTVSTPGAPSAVLAVAGPQSALVTWEAPASDGGATVTTYQVDYSSDAAITWTTTATDATLSHTVEGLTAGGEYVFRVSATNSVGTGDASVASTTVTVGHSITVGYGDDLYAALLEAGDSIGDTSETFQRRAMAIADYYLDLLTYPDPIESAPDTSGPNTVTSTYTAAEYDDWVVGTATGFNVDETSGQYVASYLLVFLLTRVTR